MCGSMVHLIGHINKTCQVLPGATAVPTEESVPAVREVIVITYERGKMEKQSFKLRGGKEGTVERRDEGTGR